MTWWETALVALKSLSRHRVRAGLSMLGIVFGVASVVAVVSVAEGGKREVLRLLDALGAANIRVKAQNFESDIEKRKAVRSRSEGLRLSEAEYLGEKFPLFAAYAPLRHLAPYGMPVNVRHGERTVTAPAVVGTTASFLEVTGFKLREGRFLNELDERNYLRVCVLEDEIRREIWPFGEAVGKRLFIDNEPYQVVGVLASKPTGERKFEPAAEPGETSGRESDVDKLWKRVVAESRLNRRIYVPLSCAVARTTQAKASSEIDEVIFKVRSVEDLPAAKDTILRFLTAAHRVGNLPPADRDFSVEVAMDLIRQTQENQRIFNWVIGAAAGISLLVGGIGIMNIMLANVTERRREIGIRRAVGASERDVIRQFLSEAMAICLVGGVVGLFLGFAMSELISLLAGYSTAIALWGVLVGLFVSIADGITFGIYPAYKAAKVDPIEALQME